MRKKVFFNEINYTKLEYLFIFKIHPFFNIIKVFKIFLVDKRKKNDMEIYSY